MYSGGEYFSTYVSTIDAGENLLHKLTYILSLTNIFVVKLVLISPSSIHISINNGAYGELYKNSENKYGLMLEYGDIFIESLRVLEDAIDNIFIAIIYSGTHSGLDFIWMLDPSNVSPQPVSKQGIWIPEGVWNGSAVWYG